MCVLLEMDYTAILRHLRTTANTHQGERDAKS